MREMIKRRVIGWIENKFKGKREIIHYLLKHERMNLFLDNLCKEVGIFEKKQCTILTPEKNTKRLALLIDTATKMYCDAAIRAAEDRVISSAEKSRRASKASKLDDFEAEQKELRAEFGVEDPDDKRITH